MISNRIQNSQVKIVNFKLIINNSYQSNKTYFLMNIFEYLNLHTWYNFLFTKLNAST